MKKFYTFAIATAVALSATALEFHPKGSFGTLPAKKMFVEDQTLSLIVPQKAAASRAYTMDDIVGIYDWNGYSLFDDAMVSSTVVIEALGTDSVTIAFEYFAGSDFSNVLHAAVNLAEGTISIPSGQYLGFNEYNKFDVYFNVMAIDENAPADSEDPIIYYEPGTPSIGVIDENGSIVFGDENELWGIGNNDKGYFRWTAFNSFDAPAPDPEIPGTWKSAGKATFVDGWMIPGMYNKETDKPYDQFANPWIVEVEQCNEDANWFRVVNPYMKPSPLWEGSYEGYIFFDVTDPTFVAAYPGFNAGIDNGSHKLRCFNLEGFYLSMDFTPEEVKEGLADDNLTYSSYSEGRVNFKNCRFNMKGAEDKMYSWQYTNAAGQTVPCANLMYGELVFDTIPDTGAGIDNITVDNNAPAVYYNMQGMRVDNPTNGLYIRKQGNSVTKVMAK